MKLAIVALLALGLMIGIGYAEDKTSADADWDCGLFNKIDLMDHTHQYVGCDKIDDPLGVGVDVKILDIKKLKEVPTLNSVNLEGKYDIENNGYSVYAVLHVDLTELYQK